MARCKKWLIIAVFASAICIATVVHSAGTLQNIQVNMLPLRLIINGVEIASGAFFNGKEFVPQGFVHRGTTYVPLRLVAETLGKKVDWDGTSNTIRISDPALSVAHVKTQQTSTTNQQGLALGSEVQILVDLLGEPQRKDPDQYGYQWWVYNKPAGNLLMVGVKDNRVVALYTNSPAWSIGGISPGTSKKELDSKHTFQSRVSFRFHSADFTVELNEKDLAERPLTVEGNIAATFFLDTHKNGIVSAIRVMELGSFLATGGYSMSWSYFGTPPDFSPPKLTETQKEQVAAAYEKQIFDLVNTARIKEGLPLLAWHESAARIAKSHSQDMAANNFFSHESPQTGSLADRFRRAGILYRAIGENIAWGYPDAITAHEGWLNSPSHRENVFSMHFTALGVGVQDNYYTQNFIRPR
ncbi:MAG: CAP-associated domain-containing protein [Bacillota bacterium]